MKDFLGSAVISIDNGFEPNKEHLLEVDLENVSSGKLTIGVKIVRSREGIRFSKFRQDILLAKSGYANHTLETTNNKLTLNVPSVFKDFELKSPDSIVFNTSSETVNIQLFDLANVTEFENAKNKFIETEIGKLQKSAASSFEVIEKDINATRSFANAFQLTQYEMVKYFTFSYYMPEQKKSFSVTATIMLPRNVSAMITMIYTTSAEFNIERDLQLQYIASYLKITATQ